MMRMEDQGENFDQLRRLLTLKRHEVPPPGYFNRLPGKVINRICMEREAKRRNAYTKFDAEAPWLTKLWRRLAGRPVFAGGFSAALCSLILAGIFLAEKPAQKPNPQAQRPVVNPFIADFGPGAAPVAMDKPSSLAATNLSGSSPQNLFEMVQPYQTEPVALQPNQ